MAAVVLGCTRWGRELRAIGGDRRASRAAGVRVDRLLVGTFVASGVLSALGGSLLSFSLGSANPDPGVQPLILAVAAALLGGASLAKPSAAAHSASSGGPQRSRCSPRRPR